jgi:hypothetical protein
MRFTPLPVRSELFCSDFTRSSDYQSYDSLACRPTLTETRPMFSAQQYRAKANEYSNLARTANGPDEVHEFQRLERSFTELADNAEWVTDNHGRGVRAIERATAPFAPAAPAQNVSQQ